MDINSLKEGGIVSIRDHLLNLQASGLRVYRLESGGPSFPIPQVASAAINRALHSAQTKYTPSTGIPSLREAIHHKLITENNITSLSKDHILVTPGAMNGLYIAYQAINAVCGPCRNEVICISPRWTETAYNAELAGMKICNITVDQRSRLTANKLNKALNIFTGAISINTPNNPAGYMLDELELNTILDFAQKHDLYVISDEAYEHITYGKKHVSLASLSDGYEKIISIFSASKSYSMAGLRIGYVVTTDERILKEMTTRLRCTANGVSSLAQHGLEITLASQETKEYIRDCVSVYKQRRDILYTACQESKYLEPLLPDGAFYIWCKISDEWPGFQGRKDGWGMTAYLMQYGIGSAPGNVFNDKHSIRFAFSCSTDMVAEASEKLVEAV